MVLIRPRATSNEASPHLRFMTNLSGAVKPSRFDVESRPDFKPRKSSTPSPASSVSHAGQELHSAVATLRPTVPERGKPERERQPRRCSAFGLQALLSGAIAGLASALDREFISEPSQWPSGQHRTSASVANRWSAITSISWHCRYETVARLSIWCSH